MTQFFLIFSALLFMVCSTIIITNQKCGLAALFFSIYHIFFFIIPGIIHSAKNRFPFYDMAYPLEIQLEGATIVFLFSIFVWIGYFLTKGKKNNPHNSLKADKHPSHPLIFTISILLLLQAYAIQSIGIENFVAKRSEFNRDAFGANFATRELLILAIRSISFACLILSIYFRESLRVTLYRHTLIALSAFLFFIINYPLALPRFVIFSYAIFIISIYLPTTRKLKTFIFLGIATGLTTIFPFFSYITRGDGEFNFDPLDYYGYSGDFDGFQSLLNVIQYTHTYGFQLGYQLSGAIFSLAPRAIWLNKPLATGSIAADHAGYAYTNISSPLISELYIDFGYLGVTALAIIIGYLLRKIDNLTSGADRTKSYLKIFITATFLSYLIIILRGPLIGAVNHFFIEIIIFTISIIVITHKNIIKRTKASFAK